MSNLIMSVPKSNFVETLVLMCLANVCFCTFATCEVIVGHRDIYYAKSLLHYFGCVEVLILVEK